MMSFIIHNFNLHFVCVCNFHCDLFSLKNCTLLFILSDDLFGQLLAWISLAPMGIGAGFVALILFRRDLHTVTIDNFFLC